MKNDADYWLLSDAADVSITDIWRTDGILLKYFQLPHKFLNFAIIVSLCLVFT